MDKDMTEQVLDIWIGGGWVMIPLFLLACLIYVQAFQLFFYSLRCALRGDAEKEWPGWVKDPAKAPKGLTSEIIEYTQREAVTSADLRNRFDEVNMAIVNTIDRRTRLINTMVATAPLMGLLGTVLGMLATFYGIATSAGAQTMDVVAGGIRVALITTATGLTIALPGVFLVMIIMRRKHHIASRLARLESITLSTRLFND